MSAHPEFADAIAAHALNALDAGEVRALEAHLAVCADCRAELADLRRVVTSIGVATAPAEAPPPDLRAKVLAAAAPAKYPGTQITDNQIADNQIHAHQMPVSLVAWLVAAASIAAAAGVGFYALMQRQQAADALAAKAAADARIAADAQRLRGLQARIDVLTAPDAVRVVLAGQPDAPAATASVVMSPTKGMVLSAEHLPALAPGRIYQLWVVTKAAPVSIGTFEVAADGSVVGTMPIAQEATIDPVAVAVTIEPAGGVPAPTGPKVLVGAVSD